MPAGYVLRAEPWYRDGKRVIGPPHTADEWLRLQVKSLLDAQIVV